VGEFIGGNLWQNVVIVIELHLNLPVIILLGVGNSIARDTKNITMAVVKRPGNQLIVYYTKNELVDVLMITIIPIYNISRMKKLIIFSLFLLLVGCCGGMRCKIAKQQSKVVELSMQCEDGIVKACEQREAEINKLRGMIK